MYFIIVMIIVIDVISLFFTKFLDEEILNDMLHIVDRHERMALPMRVHAHTFALLARTRACTPEMMELYEYCSAHTSCSSVVTVIVSFNIIIIDLYSD